MNIWCHPWVPGIEGHIRKLKSGVILPTNINRVADLLEDNSGTHWKRQEISEFFEAESAEAIVNTARPSTRGEDELIWAPDPKGMFSAKSAYIQDQKRS